MIRGHPERPVWDSTVPLARNREPVQLGVPAEPFIKERDVPKYLIDREVPGVGKLSAADLQGMSARSNNVIRGLNHEGHDIQWVHSFITDNRILCVYIAPDEQTLREHAIRGEFPVNSITLVETMIDPMTGEQTA